MFVEWVSWYNLEKEKKMLVEIVDVGSPVAVKKYHTIEVAYKADGKVQGKKLMSFLFPEVYSTLSKAQRGEVYDITSVKNDAGYWDWTGVEKTIINTTTTSSSTGIVSVRDFKKESATAKSNYETAEERAARQVLIVRQSSLSTAVAAQGIVGKLKTADDIINLAKEFEAYVFGGNPRQLAEAAVVAIESDLPE